MWPTRSVAVSSSRYTTTEGLDTSVQNMEESRSAFPETHPQMLGMPAQRTAQMPVPNAGPLPTQMWGQPPAPMPGQMTALMAAQMSPQIGGNMPAQFAAQTSAQMAGQQPSPRMGYTPVPMTGHGSPSTMTSLLALPGATTAG